jgi:membrane protease YdiL (CAAX protease family)
MKNQQKPSISYPAQLGILVGLCGAGLLIGGLFSVALLFGQLGMAKAGNVEELLKPENVNILRWLQIISTFFMFFIPAVVFGRIVSKKPFQYLGYNTHFKIEQLLLVVVIMIACLPVAGALAELTEKIPLPTELIKKFKAAEENYSKQVKVLMAMKSGADYIWALLIVAILPAIFEETFFRGGLQNILIRWTRIPVVAIVITSIIFSAIHFSFYGFLARAALGLVLGMIYYYSGNIWLSMLGHLFNNGAAVTFMYYKARATGQLPDKELDTSSMPLWTGIVGLIFLVLLLKIFIRTSKPLKLTVERDATPPEEDNWMFN